MNAILESVLKKTRAQNNPKPKTEKGGEKL